MLKWISYSVYFWQVCTATKHLWQSWSRILKPMSCDKSVWVNDARIFSIPTVSHSPFDSTPQGHHRWSLKEFILINNNMWVSCTHCLWRSMCGFLGSVLHRFTASSCSTTLAPHPIKEDLSLCQLRSTSRQVTQTLHSTFLTIIRGACRSSVWES